ncbi:MAG: putrescine ABC transporter permease PotH [Thiotrichales bacterium]|nr:MAG: putrescine ABC transporter permease PotH [Thiotrichales bacterium]
MRKKLSSTLNKLQRLKVYLLVMPPFLWYFILLFLPFLLILKISFTNSSQTALLYTSLLQISHKTIHIVLHLDNYIFIFAHSAFIRAFFESIKFSFVTTLLCILVGYPLCYAICQTNQKIRKYLFFLLIFPYWTSFLLRAYAWINILQNNGVVNKFLLWSHIIHKPLHMIYTNFSVYIGMLYAYLPFFILPLYVTLSKMDDTLLEAAEDLGCSKIKCFFNITLPISKNGIYAGALLVFIPAIGEVVVPNILGGINNLMIGNVIWQEFLIAANWGLSAALSVVMLMVLLLPILILQKSQTHKTL